MNTTHHQVHEDLEARALLADIPSIQLLTTVIHERKVYRECMAEGRGVVEMQNEKANQEIEGLVKEILG
jgi:chromosome partitioning protein